MWAATRNYDGVGYKVEMAFDYITPDSRNANERAHLRSVDLCWMSLSVISQKRRPDILARTEKNRIGMSSRLIGQSSDMQPAESDVGSPGTIMVGQFVRSVRRSDIDLDHHQLRIIIEVQPFHMFILDSNLVIVIEISGQRCKTERGKKGIFNWTKIGADGFCQSS